MENHDHHFLSEEQIEELLHKIPALESFWENPSPLLIFRSRPCLEDPVFEVQLAWDLGDRIQTYAWIWMDAREGMIIRRFPD
jgi:hypothetical protein